MANTAQAKKRARQSEVRRQLNASQRSSMRTSIKKVIRAIDAGDQAAANATFKVEMANVDSMASKGQAHKNTVARQKSRLNARIKALAS